MIALDLDGTILNYGGHVTQTRFNHALLALLPAGAPVAILTNQGGMAFSRLNPDKYPAPKRVAQRLEAARMFLAAHGHAVTQVLASCYHPRAAEADIQRAAQELRGYMSNVTQVWCVYTTERARKPHPFMLKAAKATVYYGDSPEDAAAAQAAGIAFVPVFRFA